MKKLINNLLVFFIVGALLGWAAYEFRMVSAYLLTYITRFRLLFTYVCFGGILGLFSFFIYYFIRRIPGKIYFEEVKLTIPEFSEMTIKVNNEYRLVAWKLFVESITRIATQPLDSESGHLREALNSLYSLFSTSRELLKSMKPTPATDGTTVELFAIGMLNDVIRPFLAKWHRLLTEFEKKYPDKRESDWKLNKQFRQELEDLRIKLLRYTRGFGEIAGVQHLEKYIQDK